jgi:hypothetical protein
MDENRNDFLSRPEQFVEEGWFRVYPSAEFIR